MTGFLIVVGGYRNDVIATPLHTIEDGTIDTI